MSCETEAAIDKQIYDSYAQDYSDRANNAVMNLIGDPSTSVGEHYHKWHQKLYDLLYDHIIEIGTKYNGGVFVINPIDIINAFQTYLTVRKGGNFSSIFAGTHSMKTMFNIAKEGIALKNKNIHTTTTITKTTAVQQVSFGDTVAWRVPRVCNCTCASFCLICLESSRSSNCSFSLGCYSVFWPGRK